MNLITLFTVNGPVRVNSYDIQNKTIMPVYNRKGERYDDWNTTQAQKDRGLTWGVHKENLFASKKLAEINRERILAELFADKHL